MSDSVRIAELRRRVHADPASIAFAQLAEEYRRAGQYADAVKYCRTGLARHPGYVSARITMARALMSLDRLDEAAIELEQVLKSAPNNVGALRGLGEIHERRGAMGSAVDHYKCALQHTPADPELLAAVHRVELALGAAPPLTPPRATGVDFDALLTSLGAPGATAPAGVEHLLTGRAPAAAAVRDSLSGPAATDPTSLVLAALERELRVFNQRHGSSEDAVLEELESWLDALETERTRRQSA